MRIVHVPGYSLVDHVGPELVRMAQEEWEGRPRTRRSAEAAIQRAYRRARRLGRQFPASYGAFRYSLPRLEFREEEERV